MKRNLLRWVGIFTGLACLALTCELVPVEHTFENGSYTLTYWQVGQERNGRTQVDVRFAARLESSLGTNQVNLEAYASSSDAAMTLPEDTLRFSPLAAGEEAVSLDSFTIRQDRTVPFDPTALSFAFAQVTPPTPAGFAGTIGALGGQIDRNLGQVELDFAVGALPSDTPISIVPLKNLGSGAFEFLPDGSSFSAPVEVTISYAGAPLSPNVDENDFTIQRIEDDETLTSLPTTVDTAAKTLTATLTGFSRYRRASVLCSNEPGDPICMFGFRGVEPEGPGELDSSFGNSGWSVISSSTILDKATDLVLQPDGKILIGGNNNHMIVWRLREDGTLDTSFSGDGEARVQVGLQSFGDALALQDDGKILLVGGANDPPPTTTDVDPVILRFDAFGQLDPTFANNGVLLEQDPSAFRNFAVDLYPGGRILTLGNGTLFQYLEDGSRDLSFANDGVLFPAPGLGSFIQVLGESSFRTNGSQSIKRVSDLGVTQVNGGLDFGHPPRSANAVVGNTIFGIQQATSTEDAGLYFARFSNST
ncbi:MAG: delta-60 repeat domain-containing protein, partial [Myxococcota bacterium]